MAIFNIGDWDVFHVRLYFSIFLLMYYFEEIYIIRQQYKTYNIDISPDCVPRATRARIITIHSSVLCLFLVSMTPDRKTSLKTFEASFER